MKLDVIDLKILKVLQENSKITNIELSKQIGLSAAPTLGRVQKLEKQGFISSYHAKVDTSKLGLGFMALVQVSMQRQNSAAVKNFLAKVNEIEEIGYKVKNFSNLTTGINSSTFKIEGYQKKYLLKIPIDDFYEKYKDEYEIIFKGYQIAFKKKIS